jgi:glutathione-regulated potassium-efflux system ancillary protein KefF
MLAGGAGGDRVDARRFYFPPRLANHAGAMICLVYAHPYPDRSRGNRELIARVRDLPELSLRSLYDLYPDFAIDVEAEQAELVRADLIVFQHPIYWYSVPGLLKHWFDKVLARGFAYGEGGRALVGKRCLWVATTGGDPASYAPGAPHGRAFDEYVPPIEQTALFCGMHWEKPLIIHGVHRISEESLHAYADEYRGRLSALVARRGAA